MKNCKKCIFFIGKEPEICGIVKKMLEAESCNVTYFSTAVDCLAAVKKQYVDCIITDINMIGMDGLGLLKEVKKIFSEKPVLMIIEDGDIETAVRCMRKGAADIIEKPLNTDILREKIKSILNKSNRISHDVMSNLSRIELVVLELVLSVKSSNSIGYLLDYPTRTIEDHRYKIMKKLGFHNVVDLVKAAVVMD